jgi:hypothetical protein
MKQCQVGVAFTAAIAGSKKYFNCRWAKVAQVKQKVKL